MEGKNSYYGYNIWIFNYKCINIENITHNVIKLHTKPDTAINQDLKKNLNHFHRM